MSKLDDNTIRILKAVPEIPMDRKCWGKEYSADCPCGGVITAIRSTYNGHMMAKCDKCAFILFE